MGTGFRWSCRHQEGLLQSRKTKRETGKCPRLTAGSSGLETYVRTAVGTEDRYEGKRIKALTSLCWGGEGNIDPSRAAKE